MKITAKSGELTLQQQYDFMYSSSEKMQSRVGESIFVNSWVIGKDTDNNGVEHDVLIVEDENGTRYGTISPTFIKSFQDALVFCSDSGINLKEILVIEGTSSNGRKYIDCRLKIN